MKVKSDFGGRKRSLLYRSLLVLIIAALVFAVSCSDTATYYNVYFYTNGGTSVPSQQVRKGGYAQVPLAPQKEGYNFAGWYANSLLTIPYLFNEPVTKETLLYAKWEEGLSASDYTMPEGDSWFTMIEEACDVKKSQVKKISFLREFSLDVDVKASVPLNKGLMAYIAESDAMTSVLKDGNASMYDMYIVGEHFYCNADSSSMFEGFGALEEIDLTNFNTSNVTNMGYMFYGCKALVSTSDSPLDLSGFDTSNVTNMQNMFMNCSELEVLNLNFDTSKVTNMSVMFYGCSSLTSITFGNSFDTSSVVYMVGMFGECSSLESLDLSGFDTSSVKDMNNMFNSCKKLENLNVSGFDTSKVECMARMFYDCEALTTLDLSSFDVKKVGTVPAIGEGNFDKMFCNCSDLETIYAASGTNWSTSDASSKDMFGGCDSLVGGNGTEYSSTEVDKTYARIDGGPESLTPGYFTVKTN